MATNPFQLMFLPRIVRPLVAATLRLSAFQELYAAARAIGAGPFERRALDVLNIATSISGARRIPASGALIVVANHPHGAVDGLALVDAVRRARPDVRLLANRLLAPIPELRDSCFFVDPFGGPQSAERSRAGLRAAHHWLRGGGALVVFPAGEVAHTWNGAALVDSPWQRSFARLAAATRARVLPAFIDGRNSALFYRAGRVHAGARTVLLPRELLKKRGATVRVRFGAALASEAVSVDTAREAVEALGSAAACRKEVERLPADACVAESGAYAVFCAEAHQIPLALREIGRLREVTYRAAGEGTGRPIDLDQFDRTYLHLFVWNREAAEIVGAYRIGRTDRIAASQGMSGLYTRTLFQYDERLLERLGAPALELGRSFVRAEYQKNYHALLLLWKGICQFVACHPEYRILFGPVSISATYSTPSRERLTTWLEQRHRDRDLAALVQPVNPPPPMRGPQFVAGTATAVQMPVLLRQYLKLNARVVGFNIDPAFGGALDALMVVDLLRVEPAILARYFGGAAAAEYLAQHRAAAAA